MSIPGAEASADTGGSLALVLGRACVGGSRIG